MKKIIGILAILPTLAFGYISSEGDEYRTVETKNKIVLTSHNKKIYIINAAIVNSGKHIISLYKDCKATSNLLGKGKWEWANGGMLVYLDFEGYERSIGFPRQDPPFDGEYCQM